ncbi:MAG: hypothetical protein AAB477_02175 [Patescibacteria group bacterium]
MAKKNKQINNRGYAILFAVVIVSVISLISVGLSNTTYKQLVLSSLANDSQSSYFQSDMATECALYAENIVGMVALPSPWNCGINSSGSSYSLTKTFDSIKYTLASSSGPTIPCFEFDVQDVTGPPVSAIIKARGYNICNKTSSKAVEREIRIDVRY